MNYPIEIIKSPTSSLPQVDFENLPFGKIFTDHMFTCEYRNGSWGEAKIEPMKNFELHPSVSALHYGQSVFEGMKAQVDDSGTPMLFRYKKNISRLNQSAHRMAMPQIPEELFEQGLMELMKIDSDWIPRKEGYSLYIRPFMFATDEYVGIKISDTYKFCIFCSPVGAYYTAPVKVYIEDYYHRSFPGGVGYAKAAGNYAAALFPAQKVKEKGYDQILWIDSVEKKYLQEIGTMNVFLLIGEKLITPSNIDGTILEGVTRESVITLAKDMGVTVEVRNISVQEVLEAYQSGNLNDAFGSGTAATISHISDIGYKDQNMELPPIGSRILSNSISRRLHDIKTGKEKDKFGWVTKVPVEALS